MDKTGLFVFQRFFISTVATEITTFENYRIAMTAANYFIFHRQLKIIICLKYLLKDFAIVIFVFQEFSKYGGDELWLVHKAKSSRKTIVLTEENLTTSNDPLLYRGSSPCFL